MSGTGTADRHVSLRYWRAPWKRIFGRAAREFIADGIPTVAGGAAFFALLAFFPAVAAFVSLYGIFADVHTAREHLSYLRGFLPRDVLRFVGDEMIRVTTTQTAKLSGAFIVSVLFSIWSANAGVSALIGGLNAAYEQKETRSLIATYLLSLAITVGALIAAIAAFIVVVALPVAQSSSDAAAFDIFEPARWLLLFAGGVVLMAVLFRYGPNCRPGAKRRVLLGATFASAVWLLVSLAFSWYLRDFAHYDQTYGSLGALMGFMMWVWLGVMVILFGGELNAEIERVMGG